MSKNTLQRDYQVPDYKNQKLWYDGLDILFGYTYV